MKKYKVIVEVENNNKYRDKFTYYIKAKNQDCATKKAYKEHYNNNIRKL